MSTVIPAPQPAASVPQHVGSVVVDSPKSSAHGLAWAHRLVARLLLGGIALQLFFAGLGVFGISSFLPHVIWGTIVVIASIALPLLAWRGQLGVSILRRSWLLVGLMVLQGALVDLGRLAPIISALHPVNAMVLALVTFELARREL